MDKFLYLDGEKDYLTPFRGSQDSLVNSTIVQHIGTPAVLILEAILQGFMPFLILHM